ncbi:MAG TPA: hypothetical protein VJ921_04180 [Vicinamibacteria bacterium]|nr:hypothetical protein [Vicinamibacteria bacterium]
MRQDVDFRSACDRLEAVLGGPLRAQIVQASSVSNLVRAFGAGSFPELSLQRLVDALDARTRADGFHVLHDWDGKRDRLNEETIPEEVARYAAEQRADSASGAASRAILLDYYFLYVLALLALRAWDEGDPSGNLERVSALLGTLQGPLGSGQRFVDDAETLLLLAVSHFEPDVTAYDRLLAKVRTLDEDHRTKLALAHAAILASHLRFGFEATYGRDILEMRRDNAPDYPWLLLALGNLLGRFARGAEGPERDRVVEGILNGLTPDPRAFVGTAPAALAPFEAEHSKFRELWEAHRDTLLSEFERQRPSEHRYSPLSFFFNFPHNLLKGVVIDALLKGEPWRVSLNSLLTGIPHDPAKTALAKTMMGYAQKSPDRIRGRLTPIIVYDPPAGRRAFQETLRRIAPSGS